MCGHFSHIISHHFRFNTWMTNQLQSGKWQVECTQKQKSPKRRQKRYFLQKEMQGKSSNHQIKADLWIDFCNFTGCLKFFWKPARRVSTESCRPWQSAKNSTLRNWQSFPAAYDLHRCLTVTLKLDLPITYGSHVCESVMIYLWINWINK